MFRDLVVKNRSYRRFYGEKAVSKEMLMDLIDTARIVPSGMNRQAMRYRLTCTKVENALVYSTLGWAGYYKDWDGPVEEERPTAYVICLHDLSLGKPIALDAGIAVQTIALAATEKGLGCCILLNCKHEELFRLLGIDKERYAFCGVIAIGYPLEKVQMEEIKEGNFRYYRTEDGVQHVPKRCLEELLV